MSFGKNSSGGVAQFWSLNGKECMFQKKEKVDGEYQYTDKFDTFEGVLTDASLETWEDDNGKHWKVVFEFEDDEGQRALLDIKFQNVLVGILNSLAVVNADKAPAAKFINAADKPSPFGRRVRLSVWGVKVGTRTHCRCAVRLDGQKTEWAFTPDIMASLRGALKENMPDKLANFFNYHIKPLAEQYNLEQPKGSDAESYFPSAEDEPKSEPAGVEDDMPF